MIDEDGSGDRSRYGWCSSIDDRWKDHNFCRGINDQENELCFPIKDIAQGE